MPLGPCWWTFAKVVVGEPLFSSVEEDGFDKL